VSAPDTVIHEALVARIVQLTAQVEELEAEVRRRKSRAWELRVGLNNVLTSFPDGDAKPHYQAILDQDDDQ
jgi:hypothetical protein